MTKTLKQLMFVFLIVFATIGVLSFTGIFDDRNDSPALSYPLDDELNRARLHGEIHFTYGEIYKLRKDTWVEIMEGEIVSEGDIIKTNTDSRVTILFDDGSTIRLAENSEIEIESIQRDEIKINEILGLSYNRVTKVDNRDYIIRHDDVETKALGTAFTVAVDGDDVSVEVFESEVKVTFKEGEQKLSQGEKIKINQDNEDMVKDVIKKEIVEKDEFIKWNKEEDAKKKYDIGILKEGVAIVKEKVESVKEVFVEEGTGPVKSIKLSASGNTIRWEVDGESAKGFKIVWSKEAGPTYPRRPWDAYKYFKDPRMAETQIEGFAGDGTYYVRVCEYLGGACGVYSNEAVVNLSSQKAVPKQEVKKTTTYESSVGSIILSAEGSQLKWASKGTSDKGYKIVWSKNPSPTYPSRSGDKAIYSSDPRVDNTTIYAFDGSGVYYARVCEYLGGKCGTYSNQVVIKLEGEIKVEQKSQTKTEKKSYESVSSVKSIGLSMNGKTANWTVDGYSSKGFKLVWSKNPNPTYPKRSGDKYIFNSSPGATSAELHAFDGDGTYYVRVCEYLGGKCGLYSNEVAVELE